MGAQRKREEQSEVLVSSSHSNFDQNAERTVGKKAFLFFFFSAYSLLSFTAQQVSYFKREKGTKISTHFSISLISLFFFPCLHFPSVFSFPILSFVRQNGGR